MSGNLRTATLTWSGDGLLFSGRCGEDGPPVPIDGDSRVGPSPMEALLLALGGCMAIDIQVILEKQRVPLGELEVTMEGERAEHPPRRYTRVHMQVRTTGVSDADAGKLDRAIELSRDKYCSVFHTLHPDLIFEVSIVRE